MTVKNLLGSYNIGRSAITTATVVNQNGEGYTFSKRELCADAYGARGAWKVTTFTITPDNIVIYTEGGE